MLFQHHNRLGIGCDSAYAAASHQLVALPSDIQPSRQHLAALSPPVQRYSTPHSTKSSREYAGSRAQERSTIPTARKAARGRIMQQETSASSSSPPPFRLPFEVPGTADTAFNIQASSPSTMTLSFRPRPLDQPSSKRGRALADIDGEHSCLYKKKRRLRLFLITSRLSPQFSHPATNIVDRGSSKIAVWAKQKALGRNLLRKAAILNRIRLHDSLAKDTGEDRGRSLIEKEKEQNQFELAKLALIYGSHDPHTRPFITRKSSFPPTIAPKAKPRERSKSPKLEQAIPVPSPSGLQNKEQANYRSPNDDYVCSYPPSAPLPTDTSRKTNFPLPPSPLGLSNYDAFDIEDDIPDPYSHFDDDDDENYPDQSDYRYHGSRYPNALAHGQAEAHLTTSNASTQPAPSTTVPVPAKTPPRVFYSDFSILDPGEPVVGDYDQIDEGVWPNVLAPGPLPPTAAAAAAAAREQLALGTASCSPNFPALFATSVDGPLRQE